MASLQSRARKRDKNTVSSRGETTSPARSQSNAGKAGKDRRRLILKAAAARFAEFGFEATTVRQIADDVDILSGSLYHHFATKEEILDEIVRDAVLDHRDQILKTAALLLSPEERIVALIRNEIEALTGRLEAFSIVFHELKFFRRSEHFAYLIEARKVGYDAWRSIIEEGIEQGLFHQELDVHLTIATVARMLNAAADLHRNEDGSTVETGYSLEELTEFYVGFILRSIRAPSRTGEPIPDPPTDM